MELLNLTEAETNVTVQLNFTEYDDIYKATGVLHLLIVVIPVLTLGPTILGLFISNKKLRDPSSILFMCITCVCIVGPSTYGLLMDVSLITDLPILGTCEVIANRAFWFQLYMYQITLMVNNSLLIVIQYIAIRWGSKKLPIKLTLALFFIVVLIIFAASFLNVQTEGALPVRGSLCYETGSILIAGIVSILVFVVPSVVIAGVFSILTVKYVQKNIIQNKKAVRNVQIIMVAMTTSVIVFRFLPIILFFIQPLLMSVEQESVVSWVLMYSSELSYPLFHTLTLLVHKAVRTTLVEKIKLISCTGIKTRSIRVSPTSQTTKTTNTMNVQQI